MSKADGWTKFPNWTWRKQGDAFRAEICQITGNNGRPFAWSVYPLPRSQNLDERGRYNALGRGSERKLADAKAKAEAVISEAT